MAYFKCGGSSSGIELLHGSSDPASATGENGQIYLKTQAYGEDISSFTDNKENSMTIVKSRNRVDFTYGSGGNIGAQTSKQFDLTDVNELTVTISCGTKAYQSDFTNRHPRLVIVETLTGYPDTPTLAEVSTADTSQTFTIDVSSYTGNQYIVLSGNGCSCSFDTLLLDGHTEDVITAAKLKVNGSWTDLIGSDLDDVDL